MDERTLIEMAQAGDRDALKLLVKTHEERFIGAFYAITLDMDLAKDLVQVGFINFYNNIHRFDTSRPFAPYFHRILSNLLIDHRRKNKHLVRRSLPFIDNMLDRPDPSVDVEALYEGKENSNQIWTAVTELPEKKRQVIVLKYREGLTENEISEVMNCPVNTVKSRHRDATRILRDILDRKATELSHREIQPDERGVKRNE